MMHLEALPRINQVTPLATQTLNFIKRIGLLMKMISSKINKDKNEV